MEILSSRRSFLTGAAALSLSGCMGAGLLGAARSRLKFGVISDIHITDWDSTEIFRKALRYYRDAGVDAVLIAGDLADHGILPQLENVAKAWFEVFPEDRALDGRKVDRIFIYGNHDPEGLSYRDKFMDRAFESMGLTHEDAKELALWKVGMDKAWEHCFHEIYEPIGIKRVRGYDFVFAHWHSWRGVVGLEDWFKENIHKIDVAKPFFFTQHPHPKDTCFGPWAWGHDEGQATRALSPYANAVAFSGHSHYSLTDERNIWRGEFTSIGTSSLSYVCMPGARANYRTIHADVRENLSIRQGQLVTVTDDKIFIERRDFYRDETVDTAWRLEMPTKPSPFASRAASSAVPEFAPGDALTLAATDKNTLEVSIPCAIANERARPFDYDIILETRSEDVTLIARTWRVYGTSAALPRSADAEALPVKFAFERSLVPRSAECRLTAIARNSYGAAGAPIVSAWSVPPKPPPENNDIIQQNNLSNSDKEKTT